MTPDEVKAFGQSDEGKRLVAWINTEYERAKNLRRPHERQWYMNRAFYGGKQYVEWSTTGTDDHMVNQRRKDLHTPRLTVNKIQPIVRTEMAKLTGQKPSATVTPASNDDSDLFAATAGEQVWESLYARLDLPSKLSRMVFWLCICGTSYIKTFWDPGMYDSVSKLYGDINWLPLSPFHILVPNLLEPDLETQPWVMDVQVRPVDWVKETYADLFPDGLSANMTAAAEIMQAAGSTAQDRQVPDSILVREVWIKPGSCSILPEGGMAAIINDTIVEAAIHGIPYEHGEYPFAKFEHIPSGEYYALSTVEPLIPLQREYNRTQSQIIEAKNRSAKPQMMYRDGSLDPAKITSEPGVYIPVKGSAEFPQPVPLTELPSYVVSFNDRMENDFENISGQHAVTRGEAPAGTAATAIAYLQEQDDDYLSPTFQSIARGIEKIARQSLVLAVNYWTVPRLVKATGDDGGYDALQLRGAEIANSTDIHIDQASALPLSKSAKQAQVSDWMKMGWISPNDGFELLDMPMLQHWVSQRKVDKKAAQIENIEFRRMAKEGMPPLPESTDADPNTGQPLAPPLLVPVNSWDDHAVHVEVHNLMRKSPAYKNFPPKVQAEVQKHVQTHLQALSMQLPPEALGGQPGAMPPGASDAISSAIDSPSSGTNEEQLAPPQ